MATFIRRMFSSVFGEKQEREKSESPPSEGFRVRKAVPNPPKPTLHHGPVVVQVESGDGGVQGLNWYANCLRMDDDGDVANDFLNEITDDAGMSEHEENKNGSRISGLLKCMNANLRPLTCPSLICTQEGNVHVK